MPMYTISVSVPDVEGDSPEDVAPAIVRWLRDFPHDEVWVDTYNRDTFERIGVMVPGDPEPKEG